MSLPLSTEYLTPWLQSQQKTYSSNMSGVLSGLISGAGSIIGSGIDYFANKSLMKQQQQYNRENAEWQNQVNIANWHMQNEYNSPANQMQRLQEAGLNPYLMYGNGTTSTGNADNVQGAADVASPTAIPSHFGSVGMVDAMNTYMQSQQLKNQTLLAQSQVDYTNAQAASVMLQSDITKEAKEAIVQSYFAGLANTKSDTLLKDSKFWESQASIREIGTRCNLNSIQATYVSKQIEKCAEEILNTKAMRNFINEQTEEKRLNNQFLRSTMEDRINEVSATLKNCLIRNKNGQIEFDNKLLHHLFEKKFGFPMSNHPNFGSYVGSVLSTTEVRMSMALEMPTIYDSAQSSYDN